MNIYEAPSYQDYIAFRISHMPRRGRGEKKRISNLLGVHGALFSQVLSGTRELTPDQAFQVAEYFGMRPDERDYLVLLVQIGRAGSGPYKTHLRERLDALRKESLGACTEKSEGRNLSNQEEALFYSTWHYAGVRLATFIPELATIDRLAQYFELPRQTIREIVDFLESVGLCRTQKDRISPTARDMWIGGGMADRHLTNWRLRSIERIPKSQPSDFFQTAPMAVSSRFAKLAKERLVKTCQEIRSLPKKEDPEELYCLNVDWFKL